MSKAKAGTLMSIVKGEAAAPSDAQGRVAPATQQAPLPGVEPVKPDPAPKPPKAAKAPRERKAAPDPAPPARKRPWDGKDRIVHGNHAYPERLRIKLHTMKAAAAIDDIARFVAQATERAIDEVIAQYDRDMGNGA